MEITKFPLHNAKTSYITESLYKVPNIQIYLNKYHIKWK